jgi:type II secretory ATPase GspE/PulE/Tfp pilus assembly ATPase PilB-like protein
VSESIAAGADLVCFSGDKLISGPQAGIIVGDADLLAKETEEYKKALAADDAEAPVIKLINLLISEAVRMRASDIHVEPKKEKLVVRNRVDGALRIR